MRIRLAGVVACVAACVAMGAAARGEGGEAVKVGSPDGRIQVTVDAKPQLVWSVTFNGRPVLVESKLGLEFKGGPMLGSDVRMGEPKVTEVKDTWENLVGKRRQVTYEGRELRVRVEETGAPKRVFDLVVRASNDGVAVRYDLPEQEALKTFVLTRDGTEFAFPRDAVAFVADHNGFKSPQEAQYVRRRISSLEEGRPYGMPLLCEVEPKVWVAVSESDLLDWAGMYVGGGMKRADTGTCEIKGMTGKDAPQAVSVWLKDACELMIEVEPAGGNKEGVAVDLAEARLVRADGSSVAMSELPAAVTSPGWGMPFINARPWGDKMTMRGKDYGKGIGVFSRSRMRYVLPPGEQFRTFEAVAGIDDEAQGKGLVNISVRAQRPAEAVAGDTPVTLKTILSPRLDGQGLVVSGGARKSPWRVLMIAEHPGKMMESDLIQSLATPCKIGDASWVKPGACAWDRWWSAETKMDMKTNQEFIEFASEMGFAYQLVDWGWYGEGFDMKADITAKGVGDMDMPKLAEIARQKNVRVIAWLFWQLLDKHLEEAVAAYEKWGLAGIKVDFMDRDDQEMVNWYEKVAKACAEHHLLVNFHGAYKGTGMERTYPNQLTREGILGNEYNKSSFRINPTHVATLPYTRLLVGPGDYTPGGFLNRQPGKFRPQSPTQVMGTRARELALCVAFLNPMLCICEQPENMRGQPGAEFLKGVPAAWDETKFINGEVGEWVVVARRSGKTWYVAAITAGARTIEVPLAFLGEGQFTAEVYADGAKAADDATDVKIEKRPVTAKDVLKVDAAPAGGAAIIIR